MPFRRLVDYTGITIWIATMIFILGGMAYQLTENTSAISKVKASKKAETELYDKRLDLVEKQIVLLQMQDSYQERWKSEFMVTFKELVFEMKSNNENIISKMQDTDNSVLKASFQLSAINRQLRINNHPQDND